MQGDGDAMPRYVELEGRGGIYTNCACDADIYASMKNSNVCITDARDNAFVVCFPNLCFIHVDIRE